MTICVQILVHKLVSSKLWVSFKKHARKVSIETKVTLGYALAGVILLFAWGFAAENVPFFTINFSSPADIYAAATIWWKYDMHVALFTVMKAAGAIVFAFFVAYRVGSISTVNDTVSVIFTKFVRGVLVIPKIVIVFLVLRLVGYNSYSVMLICIWTASFIMADYGSSHSLILKKGPEAEAAKAHGMSPYITWKLVTFPMLYRLRFMSLRPLIGSILSTLAYAETLAATSVTGIGQIMADNREGPGTFGHFFFACGLLICIAAMGYVVVSVVEKRLYPTVN
ncbi:MAG: ABC-type nitrate/sulfonate/bicarbonate transport system permease component [Acidimicrobiales bacterium]|jgi:ABC-type nitrate/sulfonate/bicarbonate transport system permease component